MGKLNKFVFVGIFLILVFGGVFAAIVYDRVNVGDSVNIQDPPGDYCTRVTNDGSEDIFVPFKTELEWNEFKANYPAGILIGPCVFQECTVGGDCLTLYPSCGSIMKCERYICCCVPPCSIDCPLQCSS